VRGEWQRGVRVLVLEQLKRTLYRFGFRHDIRFSDADYKFPERQLDVLDLVDVVQQRELFRRLYSVRLYLLFLQVQILWFLLCSIIVLAPALVFG